MGVKIWIGIGLLGQALFFTRFLVQWLASEKAGESVVPRVFWYFSLAGSLCLVSYALYRHDPVFVLSVFPASVIYARNLFIRKPKRRRQLLPIAIALVAFAFWAVLSTPRVAHAGWGAVGFAGSIIWTCRFIVQWWVSERRGKMVMPAGFWIMSLVGNALLLAYSIHRKDPVFIPGQSIGFAVYARNLWLIHKARRDIVPTDHAT